MADELHESFNGGLVDAIETEADEIDEVSEALAVHGIISEKRHEQILEEVDECKTRLDQLLTKEPTAESPTLTMILERLIQIQTELAVLKESVKATSDSSPSNTPPSELIVVSPEAVGAAIASPDEQRVEELTVEPSGEGEPPKPEPKPKKYRVL